VLRFLLVAVAITGAAAPVTAQTAQPAVAYTGPAQGDLATAVRAQLDGFARRRGLGLADLGTPPALPIRTKQLLASGIEAYHALDYPAAKEALDRCVAEVESTGGAALDRRELADLFLYRALGATETGAAEEARDNLIQAATIHPSYPIDKARFRPSLVASYERARDAVRALDPARVELALPDGCRVALDGGDVTGVRGHELRPGRHYIRAECPGKRPFAASPTFAAGEQRFAPDLEPLVGDRVRAMAATAPAARVIWVALAASGEVDVALIDRAAGKALRRWTMRLESVAAAPRLGEVLESIIEREFAAPVPEPIVVERPLSPARWYQKPWVWIAVGAAATGAVALPLIIFRSDSPNSFDASADFGARR
jgi:hypothetical protein